MRILVAGASGVLGRATLPHLEGHEVVGLTRSREKAELLRELGAESAVCDVYDEAALLDLARRVRPELVVNFVTDLAAGSSEANARVRRLGGDNLLRAAEASGASRLAVESVAFALEGEAAAAVDHLERSATAFPGAALVLRFGRFWGPGTWHEERPEPPVVHIARAGAEAARIVTTEPPGIYVVSDD